MALTAEQQAEIELRQRFPCCRAPHGSCCVLPVTCSLLENDRNKPTGERGITASDITAFADTLLTYVTQ
jgi:hypothetical protein